MKKNSKNVIVEIIDVSKSFKEISVLEHVNLKLESGNIYSFIGPNGSGKTVLLKLSREHRCFNRKADFYSRFNWQRKLNVISKNSKQNNRKRY